jgi:hypothetical protein
MNIKQYKDGIQLTEKKVYETIVINKQQIRDAVNHDFVIDVSDAEEIALMVANITDQTVTWFVQDNTIGDSYSINGLSGTVAVQNAVRVTSGNNTNLRGGFKTILIRVKFTTAPTSGYLTVILYRM